MSMNDYAAEFLSKLSEEKVIVFKKIVEAIKESDGSDMFLGTLPFDNFDINELTDFMQYMYRREDVFPKETQTLWESRLYHAWSYIQKKTKL
jgi:uncharacterized protein YfkK (UPF0435 family)